MPLGDLSFLKTLDPRIWTIHLTGIKKGCEAALVMSQAFQNENSRVSSVTNVLGVEC
jgi:hypothetical protein